MLRAMPYAGRHSTNPSSPLPLFLSRRATKATQPELEGSDEARDEPLRHAHSEGCVITDREGGRTNNDHGYSHSGFARSSTMPPISPIFQENHESANTHQVPTESKHTSPQSTSTDETLTPNQSSSSEDGKPRRRRPNIPFLHRDDKVEQSADLERQPTSEKQKPRLTFWSQTKATIGSYVNILLVCVPLGIILNYVLGDQRTDRIIVFVVCVLFSWAKKDAYMLDKFPCHHPSCGYPLLCDRGDRYANRRDSRRTSQRFIW